MRAVHTHEIRFATSETSDAGGRGAALRTNATGRPAADICGALRALLLALGFALGLATLAAPTASQARIIWTGDGGAVDLTICEAPLPGQWWNSACNSLEQACETYFNNWVSGPRKIRDYIRNGDGSVFAMWCTIDPPVIIEQDATVWQVCYETGSVISSYAELAACGGPPDKGYCEECEKPNLNVGNPVNAATGNKFEIVTDFATAGPDVLAFRRYYNSRTSGNVPRGATFRNKWRSSFDRSVYFGSNGVDARLYRQDGKGFHFVYSGGAWAPAPNNGDVEYLLAADGSDWKVTTPDGTVETYNSAGVLQSIATPRGYTQTLAYDAGGLLTTVTDSYGRQLAFAYNSSNRLVTLTLPGGKTIGYAYDSNAYMLVTVTYADNSTLTYHYEDANWPEYLTGLTDGNGVRYATWAYDSDGRAISSTHAGGADQVTLSHDPANSKTTVTDALGKQKVYHYATVQGISKLMEIEDLAGASTPVASYPLTRDSNGYIASRTDREGNLTTYVRNDRGLETSRTEASGTPLARTITTTWHATLPLPLQIVRPNRTTDYTYDANGNMLTRTETDTTTHSVPYSTNGQTRTWTYTYTPAGQRASVDGPLAGTGDTTTYTYDTSGYLETTTNPLGHVTEVLTVDGWGLPTSIRDANNVVTNLAYDGRGRLIRRTVDPGVNESVTNFAYDQAGQMVKITRPDGSVLNYTYDSAHRLAEVSNDLGEKIVYTRDAMGNVTTEEIKSATGAIKKTQTRVFDELGRMLQSIGAGLQTTSFTYTKNDDLATTTDPKSNVTSNAYDALNRVITVTDALTNSVGQDYDAAGNLVSVTDQRSLTTAYVHNGFGEVIRRTSPDTGITDYVYDAAGNVTQKTDARGVVTQYGYDSASRLTSKTFPASPAENATYTYDDTTAGNYGVGRLTRVQDSTGQVDYVYDARGNVVRETRTIGLQAYVTEYAFDAADNLVAMTYPSGRIVTYMRDALGRVIYVTTQKSPSDPLHFLAAGIEYLPFGPISSLTFGNGQRAVYAYDQDYRLTDIDTTDGATPAQDLAYGYDLASNIAAITDNLDLPRNQVFDYDPLHRLTAATGLYGDIDYAYDGVGNRLSRTTTTAGPTVVTETLSYDTASNRLLGVVNGTTRTVGYTANGNITTDSRGAGYDYLYNDANRMAEVKAGGVTAALYNVNDQGQRVAKTVGGLTTHYHFDRNGALIAESDDSGVLLREYVTLAGLPIAVIDPGTPTTPVEQIIDNGDPGASATGTWTTKTDGTLQHGADYAYSAGGTGTGAFTWTPTITTAGPQRVYVRWPAANLGSTATYTVYHAHGVDSVTLDQRENAGEWIMLGVYQMQPGAGHRVELSDAAETSIPDAAVDIDNWHPDAVETGTWTTLGWPSDKTMYGGDSLVASGGGGANAFEWSASAVPETGRYRVYARWVADAGRATDAKYTIQTAGGPVVVTVNQTTNGGQWNFLGVFDLVAGAGPAVTLTDDANGSVSADGIALRLWANDPGNSWVGIWDNTNTSAVSIVGSWWTNTYTGGGQFYGSNFRDTKAGAGKSVTFNLQVPAAGRYWLYTRCVRISKHELLRFDVHHDGGVSNVYIDQRNYGGEWQMLGTYNLTPGMGHKVFIDANQPIRSITEVCADAVAAVQDANGPRRVVADAVKFVPNTAEAALAVHADHLGSPQKMTDATGAVVWDAAYTPFGQEAAISGAETNNQRFPGQYFDAETGLHQNWMRDYDPALGRYVQSDPIGLKGGLNTYGYVRGNPLLYSDPTGKVVPALPALIPAAAAAGQAIVDGLAVGLGVLSSIHGARRKAIPKPANDNVKPKDKEGCLCDLVIQYTLSVVGPNDPSFKREGDTNWQCEYRCRDGTPLTTFVTNRLGCPTPVAKP